MKFFEFIRKALSENDGTPSSIRLNNFYLVISFGAVIAFGFIWVVLYHPDLVLTYLGIIATFLAGVTGIKAYQKNIEIKSEETTEVKLAEIDAKK